MPETPPQDTVSLDALRRDIDAADETMHRALIHRGELIERLIAAKRVGPKGAAFRPGREADMMRRMAARHVGPLPVSTVEHIWREIIGTFTYLQAPYAVRCARAAEPAMRDLLRYSFGFASPIVAAADDGEAVAAVSRSGTDLAVIGLDAPLNERWWEEMPPPDPAPAGATGAKVIAALSFLESRGSLDLPPALVIGPANVESPRDRFIYALESGDPSVCPGRIIAHGPAGALVAARLEPSEFAAATGTPTEARCLGSVAAPAGWAA